jgi:hypothetical protein
MPDVPLLAEPREMILRFSSRLSFMKYGSEPRSRAAAMRSWLFLTHCFDEAIAGALLDAKVFATYSAIPEEWKPNNKQAIFDQLSERRHACVAYSPNNPTKKISIMLLCIPHE